MLENTNEYRCASLQMIGAAKTLSRSHFDSNAHPRTFSKGYLVLIYDQANDKLGKWSFDSMWYDPYVFHRFLYKGAYILADSDGHLLKNPCNGLYLNRFYA